MKHPVSLSFHCDVPVADIAIAVFSRMAASRSMMSIVIDGLLRSTSLKIKLGLNRLYTRLGAHFVGISPGRS